MSAYGGSSKNLKDLKNETCITIYEHGIGNPDRRNDWVPAFETALYSYSQGGLQDSWEKSNCPKKVTAEILESEDSQPQSPTSRAIPRKIRPP